MALEILSDPRVRSVRWHDLVPTTPAETLRELLLPIPWLALTLWLAHVATWWSYAAAAASAFVFFLTGLRVVHNAYHHALGLGRVATELVVLGLSIVMTGSMHAVKYNHLRHHAHCMDDADVEAVSARMSGLGALLYGPLFPFRLHVHALRHAGAGYRAWIVAELAANVAWFWLVFGVLGWWPLQAWVGLMLLGQCGTAFFAVWTVHHDCDRSHHIARTQRTAWKNRLSFNMFFHMEHHLFPAVPTCHLPELARRLDAAAPELMTRQVY